MKKRFVFFVAIFVFFALIQSTVYSQVVINEFSAANLDDVADNYFEYEDWIELYNTSSEEIDLTAYYLSDKLSDPNKFVIPAGVTIPPYGYLLIWCSDRNEFDGTNLHANFKITQTKFSEAIVLSDPEGVIIDGHDLEIPNQRNHSTGRVQDGAAEWGVFKYSSPGLPNSNAYVAYAEKPTIEQKAGFYREGISVTIKNNTENSSLHYTLDGSEPTLDSPIYTQPISIQQTTCLRLISISKDANVLPSFISTKSFFINEYHEIAVVSVAGKDLKDLLNGNFIEPVGNFELFNKEGKRVATASGEFDKHGNDSWNYPQRGMDFVTRDQLGYDHAIKHKIFDSSDRQKFQRIILKAAANDNYSHEYGGTHIRDAYIQELSQRAGLNLDERRYEACALYVNGEYWGLYEMREKVDDKDYAKYYYGEQSEDLKLLKTWGETYTKYGNSETLTEWNDLQQFITTYDLTLPANYAFVEEQLDLLSLVDYFILNTQVLNTDWLNWNTAWWQGNVAEGGQKWRYTLWDLDASFGHFNNYTGIPNESPNAAPCDNESASLKDSQGHIKIFSALMKTPQFYTLYINRYSDLNRSHFSKDSMLNLLDVMIGDIAVEMEKQISRWGGDYTEWENNVLDLKDFIANRTDAMEEEIADCYFVADLHDLTVIVDPADAGVVLINSMEPTVFPFRGKYFTNQPISIVAKPFGNNVFDYWETTTSENQTKDTDLDCQLEGAETVIAHFIVKEKTCPTLELLASTKPAYCGEKNGEATVSVKNGKAPYTYRWSKNAKNQKTATAFNLKSGAFKVTVTDALGCTAVQEVTIESTSFKVNALANTDNCGDGKSVATIQAIGVSGRLKFRWGKKAKYQRTRTAKNLNPGTYSFTVTTKQGCTQSGSVTINPAKPLSIYASSTNVSCLGNDGTAKVRASGGKAPYTFAWQANPPQYKANLKGMGPGNYTVTATDANGCTAVDQVIIAGERFEVAMETGDLSCESTESGYAAVKTRGDFTYKWNTGASTRVIDRLKAGRYAVTVSNETCTIVEYVTINHPKTLHVTVRKEDNYCSPKGASAVAVVRGGQAPYTYQWSNRAKEKRVKGLTSGAYSLTVTDANGCSQIARTMLVSEGNGPVAVIRKTDVSCASSQDGTISLDVAGGKAPFTFEWEDGNKNADRSGLSAGTYDVKIKDANGCETIESVVISAAKPMVITAKSTDSAAKDGAAMLTVKGGAGALSFDWDNGQTTAFATRLTVGEHLVVVTDEKGCSTKSIVNIGAFDGLSAVEDLIKFTISPNPSRDQITVGLGFDRPESMTILLKDSKGKTLEEYEGKGAKFYIPFEMADFPSGQYTLVLKTSKGTTSRQVLRSEEAVN